MVRENESFQGFGNDVLFDPNLSLKAKALFLVIVRLHGTVSLSSEILVRASSDGISTVQSGLLELERNGYLIRKRQSSGRMEYIPSSSGKAVKS
jgi:hypothetical protein